MSALVTSPAMAEAIPPTPPTSPGLPPRPARVQCTTINIDTENMDQTLRQPFYEELLPFAGRRLGDYEWIAFETVLERWTKAIKEVVTAPRRRPPNPTSQWAQRRRRRGQEEQEDRPPYTAQDLPTDPADEQAQTPTTTNNRASGRARRAAKARHLQKLYRANPGVCMRRLLEGDTPPVYCAIAEPELVAHFSAALSTPLPLGPPPVWLFPDRHPGETGLPGTPDEGDILQSPVTPEEVVTQFKRTKRTAPGIDGITYASWRWVDPQGLTLSTIYNICRVNSRVPRPWKHSTVTLIHKGGDTATIRNWRPISLQVTIYKLYSALIARRIASWAIATQAFSSAQKGFLAFDGCAEHNFILRSMMTDARRSKRDLLLTWLDLRDAFGGRHLLPIHLRTGKDTYTPAIQQNRGVKQGCPLSPILFNIALEGLLKHLATNTAGYLLAGYAINSLAYADDICVVASNRTEIQDLLNMCHEFADWAGLVFNAQKCGSLCMVNQAPRIHVDHCFSPLIGTEAIPPLSWGERYKYLGCPTGAFRTPTNVLATLRDTLLNDTNTVFSSELAEWQKLDAFRRFLFPRVTFVLKVVFPGTKWCRKLDTSLRTIVKHGLHLPNRTCTQYFYLPQALGGMGIPHIRMDIQDDRAPHKLFDSVKPLSGRVLSPEEWTRWCHMLDSWTAGLSRWVFEREKKDSPQQAWVKRRKNNSNQGWRGGRVPEAMQEEGESQPGRNRKITRMANLQRLYNRAPSKCMEGIRKSPQPQICTVAVAEVDRFFRSKYEARETREVSAEPPFPLWVQTEDTDVLQDPMTLLELKRVLKKMDGNTSPGPDRINYRTWKQLEADHAITLCILNTCRINGKIPPEWKTSTTILIHKGDDPSILDNWRPLALQNTLYKVYAAVIAKRITDWAMEKGIMSSSQKGFLPMEGCLEHNHIMTSVLQDSRRRRPIIITWLDLKDAYGSVPHQTLFTIMRLAGLGGLTLQIVRDFYHQTTTAIRTGKDRTGPITIQRGVKQGCPLSGGADKGSRV
ncbi:hypothetical protein EMCRGX_G005296 [Ephydatia muelleri]